MSGARSILLFFCCSAAALVLTSCVKLPRRTFPVGTQAGLSVDQNQTRININTASRDELEKLPGIGPSLAARIIEHRNRYGRFRRAEHIIMVRGISDRRFREMRARIVVE